MAYQDAWRVCHPDFKRPFGSLEDACERFFFLFVFPLSFFVLYTTQIFISMCVLHVGISFSVWLLWNVGIYLFMRFLVIL
jgi:hypothetical protein